VKTVPVDRTVAGERRRFFRFLLVGLVNTIFGYGLFAAFLLAGLPSELALLLATVAGVIFNFFTTGRIVFNTSDPRMMPKFLIAYVITYSANLALLKLLEHLGFPSLLAQAFCLPPIVMLSFYLLRKFVFPASAQ
jgi:putative flippase GtrA